MYTISLHVSCLGSCVVPYISISLRSTSPSSLQSPSLSLTATTARYNHSHHYTTSFVIQLYSINGDTQDHATRHSPNGHCAFQDCRQNIHLGFRLLAHTCRTGLGLIRAVGLVVFILLLGAMTYKSKSSHIDGSLVSVSLCFPGMTKYFMSTVACTTAIEPSIYIRDHSTRTSILVFCS